MHSNLLMEKESKLFFKYAIPSVLSMIGLSLYILADTYFVANGIGPIALGALNIAIPMYSFILALAILIGIGGSTLFSIYKGQNRLNEMNDIFSMVMLISSILSLIIFIIGVFFTKNIAILLGASGNTLGYVDIYLKVIMLLCPLMIFSNVIINFIRNDGNPKIAMVSMIIGTLLNIIFDYIFIYFFKWGMFGAALATAASPVISLIMGIYFILIKKSLKIKRFKYSFSVLKEVIHCGISSFLSEISVGIVVLIFNIVLLNISGDMAVAAYGIITNVALVCICIFNGVAQGMQPIISVNFGANKDKRVIKILWIGVGSSALLGIIFYIFGMVFPEQITAIFNGENSLELTKITVQGIKVYFIAFIFMGVNTVIISFYQSIMKPKESFILSILRGFILVVAILCLMTPIAGIVGVWMVIPLTEAITFILSSILLARYLIVKKKNDIEINNEKVIVN